MKFKIFDAHTDILFDVYEKSLEGNSNRFNEYHQPQLKNNVTGGIWAFYSPKEYDLLHVLKTSKELVNLKDYEVILGIEGLLNLKSVDDLKEIYNMGYRHMMLTWNEANDYATGIKGPADRGVTKEGYKVLDFMINHDMIIDLSHLNEKSFWDVVNYTDKNIILSHSNLKSFHDHPRNITDEQLYKLKEINALLGLTLVGSFLDEDREKRTLDEFMKHLNKAISVLGIDNVCFGFDFMDYFSYKQTANLEDLKNALELQNLIDKLTEHGYSDEEIEKLTYYNIVNRFSHHIIK